MSQIFESLVPDLSVRRESPEKMDLPGSDAQKLCRTLRQFAYINLLFSRARHFTRTYLLSDMRRNGIRHGTMLDAGAGGGDYARWLRREGKRTGIDVRVTCLDPDPRVISFLREAVGLDKGITVVQGSVLDLGGMEGSFDYVFANHLLHHLPESRIAEAVQGIDSTARRGFLINDLARSRAAYFGFSLFAFFFARGSFAFDDGRLSIRKGFLPGELRSLIREVRDSEKIRIGTARPGRVFLYRLK